MARPTGRGPFEPTPTFAVATAFTLTLDIPTTLARNVLIGPLAAESRLTMTRTAVG